MPILFKSIKGFFILAFAQKKGGILTMPPLKLKTYSGI